MWRAFRVYLNLFRHLMREFLRFKKYNLSVGMEEDRSLSRQLLMYSHILEKGLAMRDSRPFFGRDVVLGLCAFLKQSKGRSGVHPEIQSTAIAVIEAYLKRHEDVTGDETQMKLIESVKVELASVRSECGTVAGDGGVLFLKAEDIERAAKGVGTAIASRHSVRMYEDTAVPQDVVEDCVRIASRSPSACNLQPTRVYAYHDREKIKGLLGIQGGARGFFSEVPLLFVLTYEISLQVGPRSRMQGYTDTGLFAQSLMLALLERGIGSCPLNWAQEVHTDLKLRKLGGIRDSENIVMLISAGKLPKDYQVAASSRLPVEQRLTVHL